MRLFRQQRLLLTAGFCAALLTPAAWATPQADHEAESQDDNETDSGAFGASITSLFGSLGEAFESLDGVNGGVYRFFGYHSASSEIDSFGGSDATVKTTISGLDTTKNYVLLFTEKPSAAGFSGSAYFEISQDNTAVWSRILIEDAGTDTETGTKPVIVNNTQEISFITQTAVGDTANAEATAVISLFELTTDTTKHNDCDVNDDGVTDANDIDMMNNVINSGVAGPGANADLIAMFDLDIDGDVDMADRDVLVQGIPGKPCLDTLYGDTDLDGDVDDADLGTAFANSTGAIGAAGGKGFAQGDTDGDGDVDDADLGTIFANYTGSL